MGYLLDERGGKALYAAELPVTRDDRNIAYPAEVVTPDVNSRMMGRRFSAAGGVGLFIYVDGVSRRVAGFPEGAVGIWSNAGAIAPNGDAAIMATKVGEGGASGGNLWRVVRVDIVTGTATPLLDLRLTTGRPSIHWSPDGTRLLVLNAIASRDGSNVASVLVLDPATGSVQTVAPVDADGGWATAASWAPDGGSIVVERRAGKPNPDEGEVPSGPASPVVYELAGGTWRRSSEAAPPAPSPRILWGARRTPYSAEARKQSANPSWEPRPLPLPVTASNGLSVTLDESPDRPQRVIAAVGRRSLNLLGPSEDLAGVQISHSRTVAWTTSDGRTHRGLLTVPTRASPTPPPLVIQLSEYMPNVFRPDGSVFSGLASQATAARGIAVLQVSFSDMAGALKDEIRLTREDVDAAIASLAAAGVIDPARVAMSGFSHTGMLVRAILVQPGRFPLSAGVTNDSFTGTFVEHAYLAGVADEAPTGNALVHGGDFWDHRDRWLAEAPDLAANHATGALLDIYHEYALHMVTQILGPFKLARRPVELFIVPEGAHQLQRPRQRYASLSANVDWLDFWLQGHEDPDPAKAEQYSRWRAMRQAWTLQKSWEAAGNPAGTRPSSEFIKQHSAE
jgi:dipeptidyl aminopeptidase/acylaminoacyl peptidase